MWRVRAEAEGANGDIAPEASLSFRSTSVLVSRTVTTFTAVEVVEDQERS